MFHKHGPAPVSEKGCKLRFKSLKPTQVHETLKSHTHTKNTEPSKLTFTVRFEVSVNRWRLAFAYVHWSSWRCLGAGAEAHVGWRGDLLSEWGELHCARCHGHVVLLLDGFGKAAWAVMRWRVDAHGHVVLIHFFSASYRHHAFILLHAAKKQEEILSGIRRYDKLGARHVT